MSVILQHATLEMHFFPSLMKQNFIPISKTWRVGFATSVDY